MRIDPTARRALAAALALAVGGGCTTVKTTGTSRSGTEQLLLTGAWDRLNCTVDFRPLAGQRVFLDPQYVTVADKDWVLSSIRRAMAEQGVLLENNKDHAQVILEAALGAYGTDERSCTSGLPQGSVLPTLSLLGGLGAGAAVSNTSTSSALTLTQVNEQDAVVKAALFAYDAKSGRLLWESRPLLDAEGIRDRYFGGAGPYRVSTLREVGEYPSEAKPRPFRRE
jgi:hypothetical protein